MKKLISVLLIGILVLSGCQQNQPLAKSTRITQEGEYDIDLRGMNSNIIYATIFNMMQQPTTYLGMTVCLYGNYSETTGEGTSNKYHFCIVPDALGCCKQGVEFKCDDITYPEEGQEIEVLGVFSTYNEIGQDFYYIDASYCGLVE